MASETILGEFEIGHGVSIMWMTGGTGIYWKHPGCRPWCWLRFQPHPDSTGHQLISGSHGDHDHLTVRGSLLCPVGCGFHGFIQNGKWVPA